MNYFKKIFPFLVILILLLVIKNNISAILNAAKDANTTGDLERELVLEEKESRYLQERLKYVTTDKFVEDQARMKLGLTRPGEFFVIAPTSAPLKNNPVISAEYPNWKKWLELFF